MLGSGLFVFAPSDQVILRAVTQSLKRPLTGLSHPESILRPTLGSSSLSGCPSTHSPLCPRASLTHSGPAPAQALQPPSPAPKPEVRAGDSGAESACAKVRPSTEEPPPEQAGGPSRARRTSGRYALTPSSIPVLSSRSSCLGNSDSGRPPVPGSCARAEKRTFASVVARRGPGGGGDGYRESRSAVGMIHELLLALSGYPGSIFTWNKRSGLQVLCGPTRELESQEWVDLSRCLWEESEWPRGRGLEALRRSATRAGSGWQGQCHR